MKKTISLTFDTSEKLFTNLSTLKLADIMRFASNITNSDTSDLHLDFSLYGASDSVLLEATSYEDDVYDSYIIFDNNDVK
jgi:hypothetical protein